LTAKGPPGRWSFRRKAATAQAFIDGQLDAATIKQRFDIDLDELSSWVDRYVRDHFCPASSPSRRLTLQAVTKIRR